MKDIKACLQELHDALEDNLNLSKQEVCIKVAKKKAHYRLIRAKEALKGAEMELLEDSLITY